MIEESSYWGEEYEEDAEESCDYGFSEFCVGAKGFCEDCIAMQEADEAMQEEIQRYYSLLNRFGRFVKKLLFQQGKDQP